MNLAQRGAIDNKSALIQVMARHEKVSKPLTDTIQTNIYDTTTHHRGHTELTLCNIRFQTELWKYTHFQKPFTLDIKFPARWIFVNVCKLKL